MNNIANIRFIIGTGKTKDGAAIHPATRNQVLDQVRTMCAKTFGGWTESIGNGGWYDEARATLVVEPCVIIDCALTSGLLPASDIQKIVDHIKVGLSQECVLVQKFTGESHLA